MNEINKIQFQLNSVSYPQNYYYDIQTLEPIGLLKQRLEFFKNNAPELFWPCNSFLDIGCSIGYFLFYHSLKSKRVLGIECDKNAVDLCLQIKQIRKADNTEIINCKFSQYNGDKQYDLIFMGNSFHYLYKDEGWAVLQKLNKFSSALIILEFPMEGKHIVEIGGWKEDNMTKNFTRNRFEEESQKSGFNIVRITPSGTTGNRNIVVLKKC